MRRAGRSGSRLRRTGVWVVLSVAALGMASPALAQSNGDSVRGEITSVSRSAQVVLVEEDPSDESGSAKGEFAVDGETEILEQRDGDVAPIAFEELRIGQVVEATYSGPVAESYPTQGIAGRIVLLDEDGTGNKSGRGLAVLPDTGGPALVGVLLLVGALLARWVARFLR
jgi:hypothetical protein